MSIVKHADCLELERLEHIHKHLVAECMSKMGLNKSFDLNSMKSCQKNLHLLFYSCRTINMLKTAKMLRVFKKCLQ